MREYVMDVVVTTTYGCTVQANSKEEAEEKARKLYEARQLDVIDEGIVDIDFVA